MNFVFDIDGTLSFDGHTISQEITEVLTQLSQKHKVIFASARPIRDMMHIIPQSITSNIWIGGNGSFLKQDDCINPKIINDDYIEIIYDEIKKHDYDYMIDSEFDYSFKGDTNLQLYKSINKEVALNKDIEDLNPVCKIVIFSPNDSTVTMLESLDLSIIRHGREDLIDISPENCSKDKALQELNILDYVAFGNDANDLGMFKNALESYCVDESEYSKYATHTIKRDEIAHTISSLINKFD